MSKAFQKAKFYQNLKSGSGSKQRFSLLQEKESLWQKHISQDSFRRSKYFHLLLAPIEGFITLIG